jgi:DNA-binding transcriptional LysR family regulator
MQYRHVMDTDAMRWFQQVADGVTVTDVGELYQVTQSGVSRGLARLEAEVGTPLLHRSGRRLRMTRAGSVFKRHVDALLNDLDDGLAAVNQLLDPDAGTVAVAFQLSLGTWLVPNLVSTFRQDRPSIRFSLRQIRDELTSSVLDSGRVDLEVTTRRPADPTVNWRHLITEPLRLAVPSTHRLAGRGTVQLAEVAEEPFVSLRPASLLRQQCVELCERQGFRPSIGFEGDDLPTVCGFVGAGLGVSIVPVPHGGPFEPEPGRLSYLTIDDPRAARDIGLAWSKERRLLPAAELFRQHVIDRASGRLAPLSTLG